MPGPPPKRVHSDPDLPKRADVVVIGGGIVGVSTALELAERGHSVLLCEKGEIAGEQSSRNWGWVRISCRDPREIPLMIEAIRSWEGLDARIGQNTGYRQTGILFQCETDRDIANYTRWTDHLAPYQVESSVISGPDLDRLLPGRKGSARTALHTPIDGRAEPQWAAPAIAEGARAAGAAIMTRCAVRSLDLRGGRISGVITERGRVDADAVVLAGGAWSRLFAGNAGIDLAQLKVLNTVLRTTPVADGPEASVWASGYALRKRADGGYTVASGHANTHDIVPDSFAMARAFWPLFRADWRSVRFRLSGRWRDEWGHPHRWSASDITPFETCRVLDPAPEQALVNRAWSKAQSAFPVLSGASIAQVWAGLIDVTPDAVPVIATVEDCPGLVIATGFSGHGFGIGPGAGRLAADLVTGAVPCVDPTPFRLSRFSDGSRIAPDAGF